MEGSGKEESTLTAQSRAPRHGGALLEQYCYPERPCQHGDALGREKQKGRVKGLLFCENFVAVAPVWAFIWECHS